MSGHLPDPAAVFASALSLWEKCNEHADAETDVNLSESYNGMDQFMREVMRIANDFETWACQHIGFDELDHVWPYLLQEGFGEACLAVFLIGGLAEFDQSDCLRVAIHLRLPIKFDGKLRIPIDVSSMNPVLGSAFRELRIQTVRDFIEDGDSEAFTSADDPFDEDFGDPYFGLYGVGDEGLLEHIADRRTYIEAVALAKKIAPGVQFPDTPIFSPAPLPTANPSS